MDTHEVVLPPVMCCDRCGEPLMETSRVDTETELSIFYDDCPCDEPTPGVFIQYAGEGTAWTWKCHCGAAGLDKSDRYVGWTIGFDKTAEKAYQHYRLAHEVR